MQRNIYQPPQADLVVAQGIDGRTCPVCRRHVGWGVVFFKSAIPNRYKCRSCNSRLRFDLPLWLVPAFFVLMLLYCIGFLYALDNLPGTIRQDKWFYYLYVCLPSAMFFAALLTIYCRRKRKLVAVSR